MKVGDVVKILRADLVDRVGYVETLESSKNKMMVSINTQHDLSIFDIFDKYFPFIDWDGNDKILNILALQYNRNVLKFGGPFRQVFTTHDPDMDGRIAKIISREVKKTGKYEVCGEDGNFLTNQESRVLYKLRLAPEGKTPEDIKWYDSFDCNQGRDIVIEKCNLEYLYSPLPLIF